MVPGRAHAARHLHIDRLIVHPIDQAADDFRPLRPHQGRGHADASQTVVQPPEVLFQPQRPPAVDRDDLVHAVTEQETPVQDGHAGLIQRQKLAVEINQGAVHGGTPRI